MSLVEKLKSQMSLPVIGAPMFIVGVPALVLGQCKAGVIGSFPALNARPQELLDAWLTEIQTGLDAHRKAHHDVVKKVHEYGGVVFHDVINIRHAQKALEAGVDGLILVCAGAGGHAGALSPFALLREVRRFYSGPIALSGSITDGAGILAAEAMGADFAYIGTRFIATREANAVPDYKQMIIDHSAADVVYTPFFTGVHGNYLKPSIMRAGLDPENLAPVDKTSMNFGSNRPTKAWKDIWGVGQGIGNIDDAPPVAELVARLKKEYSAARLRLKLDPVPA